MRNPCARQGLLRRDYDRCRHRCGTALGRVDRSHRGRCAGAAIGDRRTSDVQRVPGRATRHHRRQRQKARGQGNAARLHGAPLSHGFPRLFRDLAEAGTVSAPNTLTAVAAARAIASGVLKAEALVRACLDRIAARESIVGAWTHLDETGAIAAARRVDRGEVKGLLAGVPVGIKDLIDTADMPTGYGSPIYAGHRPAWDAACVTQVRRAGGIVLGKTVTTEFATFTPGKTANPHNPRHTPGGSSSGSAAAVGDHMVPLAFGTQTAASVTRPSSFCGAVGYKATTGSYSLAGIKSLSPSFDTLGVIARSVGDAALMRSVLLGSPDVLCEAAPAAGALRIGVCRTPWWDAADPSTRQAVETAADRFAKAGHRVRDAKLPPEFAALVDAHKAIMGFEAARALADEHSRHRDKISAGLLQILDGGLAMTHASYVAACAQAGAARHKLRQVFDGFDCLLAPSAMGEAPAGLNATGDPLFSRMWTLLYVPSLTLPGLTGPQGLPVGVQIICPRGADERLMAIGVRLESIVRG
ncbi:MAG: amidase [Alphaproteobacteria bacterium]|nr:amidase [Alphaproteobacteria bacterium]